MLTGTGWEAAERRYCQAGAAVAELPGENKGKTRGIKLLFLSFLRKYSGAKSQR